MNQTPKERAIDANRAEVARRLAVANQERFQPMSVLAKNEPRENAKDLALSRPSRDRALEAEQ